MTIQPPLSEAVTRFKQAAEEILSTYEARKPQRSVQVTPAQIVDAIEQFLSITVRTDRMEGETGPLASDDVDQLADYGLSLLMDLSEWAKLLSCQNAYAELQKVSLAATDWIIRHQGQIRALEPVVNAFAEVANELREPGELERMAQFMGRVLTVTAGFIQQDMEKTNPGRPWRVLHLNRGIVATRSHNVILMQQVFDDLVLAVPEDAPGFFREGMEQMEALNYPAEVREVMSRYYTAVTRPTMH
jgi:hypothetical protein